MSPTKIKLIPLYKFQNHGNDCIAAIKRSTRTYSSASMFGNPLNLCFWPEKKSFLTSFVIIYRKCGTKCRNRTTLPKIHRMPLTFVDGKFVQNKQERLHWNEFELLSNDHVRQRNGFDRRQTATVSEGNFRSYTQRTIETIANCKSNSSRICSTMRQANYARLRPRSAHCVALLGLRPLLRKHEVPAGEF